LEQLFAERWYTRLSRRDPHCINQTEVPAFAFANSAALAPVRLFFSYHGQIAKFVSPLPASLVSCAMLLMQVLRQFNLLRVILLETSAQLAPMRSDPYTKGTLNLLSIPSKLCYAGLAA